jgi:dihydrofolate synthase/folylpolyglutamate synthase
MIEASRAAGRPELGRTTLLVAGTNGKGSTCNYLTHLFLEAGLRVGTYISPHVVNRTERIRLNAQAIPELTLKAYEKKYRKILEPLSYFERFTLIAFLYFRDQKVDLQILEVGIGGRLDATNIAQPSLSVITRIDFDHQNVLGNTIEKIAREKAGIMRAQVPVIVSKQLPKARRSLERASERLKASLIWSEDQRFSHETERILKQISKKRGSHQEQNARLALSVFFQSGSQLSALKIKRALFRELPLARIQFLRKKPAFLVDGSHNPNSLDALTDFLKTHHRNFKFEIVFGAMTDKPAKAMLSQLQPFARGFHFPVYYTERQRMPNELMKLCSSKKARVTEDLSILLRELWRRKSPVLVVGSLYLAGEVLSILQKRGIWRSR